MEKLRGIASNVKDLAPAIGPNGESAPCVTSFVVNECQVRLESVWGYPAIDDGDLVVVCGTTRGALFKALAYKNLSTREEGDAGVLSHAFTGLFVLALSIAGYRGGSEVVATIFAIIATYFVVRTVRITAAVRELDRDS